MEKVTISFKKQCNHPNNGTYYRGCFTMSRTLYEKFTGDKGTTNNVHYLTITGTGHLIKFLRENNVPFEEKRACGSFNYYIAIK